MSIVTISRGAYSKGREIAEKTAKKLGYRCISREILLEASERFNIPELKLARAIHDSPSLLERLGRTKEDYVAYIRVSLLRDLQRDNVVYHGLAGHFFVSAISHVLKVRIIAEMQDRIGDLKQLEPDKRKLSEEETQAIIERDDEQRRKWSTHLYGIDTRDPSLYDLVIHLRKITVADAVDTICNAVDFKSLRTTKASQMALDALLARAEAKVVLINLQADAEVTLEGATATVWTKSGKTLGDRSKQRIESGLKECPGITEVKFGPDDMPYLNPWHKI
ncbi:MAG: cytidylate kinase-like family protein [Deltaproteobacteria bacterium]|nr:cytidylate kinase-like family protein [Deltaproteobacteria bacterium]